MRYTNSMVHELINRERRKRGVPCVRWNQELYILAKAHSQRMAKAGRPFHSGRFALQGGENTWWSGYHHYYRDPYYNEQLARDIVRSWMRSKAGHREWLLDREASDAGVGIAVSGHGVFASWAFADQDHAWLLFGGQQPSPPKLTEPPSRPRMRPHWGRGVRVPTGLLRTPIKLAVILAGITAITLGVHGLYVYFSRLELILGGMLGVSRHPADLFLELDVPSLFDEAVTWASLKGLQSWFIPAGLAIVGFALCSLGVGIRASGLWLPSPLRRLRRMLW